MSWDKIRDGSWVDCANPMQIGCCDCGLVHNVEFRISKYGTLQRRLHRNERETKSVRKQYFEASE